MTPEPRDGTTIEYTPAAGPRRRVRLEPRSDTTWWRITEHWTGYSWYEEDREPVQDVVVNSGEVVLP